MPAEDGREPVGLMAPEDYARSRATFWGGAAVLFTDTEGKVLVLDPAYRPGKLLLPGGGVDQAERPSAAAVREVAEELGLSIGVRRLLAVDWVSKGNPQFEAVYGFPGETISIWDGGVLEEKDLTRIRLPEDEITSFHFLPPAQAASRMFPIEGRRMLAALRARIQPCRTRRAGGRGRRGWRVAAAASERHPAHRGRMPADRLAPWQRARRRPAREASVGVGL